jgi:AcrR family transcriptional regulator
MRTRTAEPVAYFECALGILADEGYGGLKLSALCSRLGVTTGAFYYNFASWSDFTHRLLEHWHADRTTRLVALAEAEAKPRARLKIMLDMATALPHNAEAAIRVWSTMDPHVAAVQHSVDEERMEIVRETFARWLPDDEARLRAGAALYLIIGHELAGAAARPETLAWSLNQLIASASSQG